VADSDVAIGMASGASGQYIAASDTSTPIELHACLSTGANAIDVKTNLLKPAWKLAIEYPKP